MFGEAIRAERFETRAQSPRTVSLRLVHARKITPVRCWVSARFRERGQCREENRLTYGRYPIVLRVHTLCSRGGTGMSITVNHKPRGTSRVFPSSAADLGSIVCDVARHFMLQGYGVCALPERKGRWRLRITRADVFSKPVPSGARCALSILLWQSPIGTSACAQASLWPSQLTRTRLAATLLWPWIGRSVWECVESSGLDQEAICAVESALRKRS